MHDITQLGYLPGYCGDPRYKFTKQFDQRVAVSFDVVDTDFTADYRVLVQCEPPVLYNAFKDIVYQHYKNFDLVLAYDPQLLELPNAREFIPVGTWVGGIDVDKTDQISYLMSSKIWTGDHRMRFQILREVEGKHKLGNFDFLIHRIPPMVPNKNKFFVNAKFHIVCENQVMDNMFSEKLLDCFKTYTVPIYYGCSNIEKYFNPQGIVKFNTIDEFKHVINTITPGMYQDLMPCLIDNHNRAKPYWEKNIYQRIEDLIQEHITFALAQTNNTGSVADQA
jgi:hypothetical protein